MIDINIESLNTNNCFDSDGTTEFKCNCNDGFDGKICEKECSLKCENNGICQWNIPETEAVNNSVSIKNMKCDCKPGFEGEYIKALYKI